MHYSFPKCFLHFKCIWRLGWHTESLTPLCQESPEQSVHTSLSLDTGLYLLATSLSWTYSQPFLFLLVWQAFTMFLLDGDRALFCILYEEKLKILTDNSPRIADKLRLPIYTKLWTEAEYGKSSRSGTNEDCGAGRDCFKNERTLIWVLTVYPKTFLFSSISLVSSVPTSSKYFWEGGRLFNPLVLYIKVKL